jgi:hypothetical protein
MARLEIEVIGGNILYVVQKRCVSGWYDIYGSYSLNQALSVLSEEM